MFLFGILAALAAPFTMTLGFLVWESHWSGSAYSLNLYKCSFASMGFLVLSFTAGRGFHGATTTNVSFLILSSIVGIIIGDWTWLRGLQLLGARRLILIDASKPFFAAFLGWALLKEMLHWAALIGIMLTVAGILVVTLNDARRKELGKSSSPESAPNNKPAGHTCTDQSTTRPDDHGHTAVESSDEKSPPDELPSGESGSFNPNCGLDESGSIPTNPDELQESSSASKKLRLGYLLAVVNVGLDTYGALLIKQYGNDSFSVWEINLLRFGFASVFMLLLSVLLAFKDLLVSMTSRGGQASGEAAVVETDPSPWYLLPSGMNQASWLHVTTGVILVTFITPSLTLYAFVQLALALVLTMGATGPLYSLVLTYRREPITWQAVSGAVMAVAGVLVLALWGTIDSNESENEVSEVDVAKIESLEDRWLRS